MTTRLAAPVFASDTWLPLTRPVLPNHMIAVGDVAIRVYDCRGNGPYIARLGFGYRFQDQDHYYPIPIGVSYPAGTPVQAHKENQP
jgi:hypothetical protein